MAITSARSVINDARVLQPRAIYPAALFGIQRLCGYGSETAANEVSTQIDV